MFDTGLKILRIGCVSFAFAGVVAPALAQSVQGLNSNRGASADQPALPPGAGPSQFLIEPEAEIKGDNIKRQTYRTDPAGKNKNWNLDIGRFQGDYNENPTGSPDVQDSDTYSGMRLRLPFRGRTEQ